MKKDILVVEDNRTIRETIIEFLTMAGYQVRAGCNGKEGIEKVHEQIPDLIVSDIMMPVLDGLGMLSILRNDPKTTDIPFIFLTGKDERHFFRSAMDSGADDYITKPFTGDELLRAIEIRFRRSAILKKNLRADIDSLTELMATYDVTKGSMEQLQEDHEKRTYHKKEMVYKEGRQPQFLFYIIEGKVRTYKTHEDGKQLVMNLYTAGDFLGYNAILEETAYRTTAEALEQTELALIPKKDFWNLLNKNAEVQMKVIKMLAKNVTEKEQRLLSIAYNTLRKKVAHTLISLKHKYHTNPMEPFCIELNREDLAAIAGTATASIIRTLTELKNDGILEIDDKDSKIRIIDAEKLEKLL
jgi:CheY-like chemotaxis protein/CRP-like cAMP-binding protein